MTKTQNYILTRAFTKRWQNLNKEKENQKNVSIKLIKSSKQHFFSKSFLPTVNPVHP